MSEHSDQPDLVEKDDNDPQWFMTTIIALVGCLITVASVYFVSALYYGVEENISQTTMVNAAREDLGAYKQQMNVTLKGSGEFPSADDRIARPSLAGIPVRDSITIKRAKEIWLNQNGK